MNWLMNEWTAFVHKCTDVRKIKYCWILLPSYILLPCETQGEVDVELINPLTPKSDWHPISPTVSPLNQKLRSGELRNWSPTKEALDC